VKQDWKVRLAWLAQSHSGLIQSLLQLQQLPPPCARGKFGNAAANAHCQVVNTTGDSQLAICKVASGHQDGDPAFCARCWNCTSHLDVPMPILHCNFVPCCEPEFEKCCERCNQILLRVTNNMTCAAHACHRLWHILMNVLSDSIVWCVQEQFKISLSHAHHLNKSKLACLLEIMSHSTHTQMTFCRAIDTGRITNTMCASRQNNILQKFQFNSMSMHTCHVWPSNWWGLSATKSSKDLQPPSALLTEKKTLQCHSKTPHFMGMINFWDHFECGNFCCMSCHCLPFCRHKGHVTASNFSNMHSKTQNDNDWHLTEFWKCQNGIDSPFVLINNQSIDIEFLLSTSNCVPWEETTKQMLTSTWLWKREQVPRFSICAWCFGKRERNKGKAGNDLTASLRRLLPLTLCKWDQLPKTHFYVAYALRESAIKLLSSEWWYFVETDRQVTVWVGRFLFRQWTESTSNSSSNANGNFSPLFFWNEINRCERNQY